MFHSRAVLLAVVALAGLGVWAVDRALSVYGNASFPLEVSLVPKASQEVVKVEACTLSRWEWVEELHQDIRRADCHYKPVEELDSRSFTVYVRGSSYASGLGLRRRYSQQQILVLKLEYADGATRHEVVEIPDGRFRRSVWVTVP